MPFVSLFRKPSPPFMLSKILAPGMMFSFLSLSAFFALPAVASGLIPDIEFGESRDQISSLPQSFDCSALYHSDSEGDGHAYCFDNTGVFGLDDGLSTAFIVDGVVTRMQYRVAMTAANYNAVLAGLRRQQFVFARVAVGEETLDVLAGLAVLDKQTLDDQLFTLVNQAEFAGRREFLMLDHRTFNRARRENIASMGKWLAHEERLQDYGRSQMVRVVVEHDEIRVEASRP